MASIDCIESRCAKRWITTCVASVALVGLAAVPAVAKNIMVGTGTPDSCTEAALQLALLTAAEERGGVIRFDCGDSPASISIAGLLPGESRSARLVVPNDTTIDGHDLITLDGVQEDGTLLLVAANTSATLRRLTVRGGPFGITVFNLGALEVDRCIVGDNQWGGIYNRLGHLEVRNSVFMRNGTFAGGNGAIFNFRGSLEVEKSSFVDNLSDGGGAGISNFGTATVRNSTFTLNVGHWVGGAFQNASHAEATIENSEFSANSDMVHGGALSNAGTLTIRHSAFHNNATSWFGGGLYLAASSVTTLSNSTISNNQAQLGGGIYSEPGASPPTLIRTTLTGNLPDDMEPR